MIYIVKDIEEDLDFGCEERLEAAPKMAVAVLADETGKELRKKVPDQHFYDEGIEPGSRVYFDENNVVRKGTFKRTLDRRISRDGYRCEWFYS